MYWRVTLSGSATSFLALGSMSCNFSVPSSHLPDEEGRARAQSRKLRFAGAGPLLSSGESPLTATLPNLPGLLKETSSINPYTKTCRISRRLRNSLLNNGSPRRAGTIFPCNARRTARPPVEAAGAVGGGYCVNTVNPAQPLVRSAPLPSLPRALHVTRYSNPEGGSVNL